MRILWFNSGLLPDACKKMGIAEPVTGGWINSQLQVLTKINPSLQILVLCLDYRVCDVQIGNIRYVSFGRKRQFSYSKIPAGIEFQVKKLILMFNPDIIHIHGTEFYFSRFLPGTYCGKPVVISIQGLISGCHINFSGGISTEEIKPFERNLRRLLWGTSMSKEQGFWRKVRLLSEQQTIKQHQFFMGRTDWDHAWIRIYNPTANYYTVNEVLRSPFYNCQRNPEDVHPFTIYCSAASSYPLKGCHWLLRAIYYLKDKYPLIKLRIAAASPRLLTSRPLKVRLRDDYYAAYLRDLIKKFGIESQVDLLPSLTAEQVVLELVHAHIFCLPSLMENSPNSLGEAMLMGVPVVATYVGGVPSMIKHGVEGILCSPGDVASLVTSIEWCFEHPEACRNLANNARKVAVMRHNPDVNGKRTLDIYQEIINKHVNEY
jgi:glycosyltransferase involved in cell wall biosynthesis